MCRWRMELPDVAEDSPTRRLAESGVRACRRNVGRPSSRARLTRRFRSRLSQWLSPRASMGENLPLGRAFRCARPSGRAPISAGYPARSFWDWRRRAGGRGHSRIFLWGARDRRHGIPRTWPGKWREPAWQGTVADPRRRTPRDQQGQGQASAPAAMRLTLLPRWRWRRRIW